MCAIGPISRAPDTLRMAVQCLLRILGPRRGGAGSCIELCSKSNWSRAYLCGASATRTKRQVAWIRASKLLKYTHLLKWQTTESEDSEFFCSADTHGRTTEHLKDVFVPVSAVERQLEPAFRYRLMRWFETWAMTIVHSKEYYCVISSADHACKSLRFLRITLLQQAPKPKPRF